MKKFLVKSLLLMFAVTQVIVISFSSCERKSAPSPQPSAVVLKFNNHEYKNYILANYFEGQDKILGMRYNKCEAPIGRAGYSPYWELPQDWLLIDWKWRGFPYNAGLCLLTALTWDKFEIDTASISGIPSWQITEPHILNPIKEILYVNALHLEQYRGKKFPNELMNHLWGNTAEYKYCEMPEKMDSLWSILQNDLSIAIGNGDLEHINDDKYAPSR